VTDVVGEVGCWPEIVAEHDRRVWAWIAADVESWTAEPEDRAGRCDDDEPPDDREREAMARIDDARREAMRPDDDDYACWPESWV
jgi:hypothetical protein